ncbi:MAG: phosphonopyruvate decarboxylase [Acidobacteria bacterium]|nr:MAG: phosphonopyruvate decarboxylase [Acidobacteriota bacterium]
MVNPELLHKTLEDAGVSFYTGVPDSLLTDFSAYIQENAAHHVIAANEGNAVALAAGSYLASGKPALVYLQNSGQGNLINPLISLTDPEVNGIPMLLLVGWRGEPGVRDEPQHIRQGAVTTAVFDSTGTPWEIFPDEPDAMVQSVRDSLDKAESLQKPVALIVRKGTFSGYKMADAPSDTKGLISREEAVCAAAEALPAKAVVVATTGKIGRELYTSRISNGEEHPGDFLSVGSMGHSSQIALGIAMEKSQTPVYCFDGDGSVIMHMGSLAINGSSGCKNFFHIVFNNASHDSVGGQPTVANRVMLSSVAAACGYSSVIVKTAAELKKEIASSEAGPRFIEVIVTKGARKDLVRPASTPRERKIHFMEYLQNLEN